MKRNLRFSKRKNMSKLKNPFLISGYESPTYFCDRQEETAALIAALKNGRNVTLRSPRRIGKTGLIRNAFYHIQQQEPNAACFYIDIYNTGTLQEFVLELGKAIIGKLDTPQQRAEGFIASFFRNCRLYMSIDPLNGSPQLGLDILPTQSQATLEEIFAYLAQSGRECYIAIDEFQQIAEYPDGGVEALLRKHVQQCSNVHFVFSGSKMHLMTEMFTSPKRPFYRSTEKLPLDVLPEEVYYRFAAEWLAQTNSRMDESVFHEIYTMVDGVTWYMQYIMNHLYELHPEVVDHEVVVQCIEQILNKEQDDYRKLINMLSLNQKQVLIAIAKEQIVSELTGREFLRKHNLPAASSVQRATEFLIDKEYLYRTENGYVVYDRFMALWIRRNY